MVNISIVERLFIQKLRKCASKKDISFSAVQKTIGLIKTREEEVDFNDGRRF